jgi:Uma2 family endonuclease
MTILIARENQNAVAIPSWVVDLDAFRRWACSDDFPQSGRYSYLNGDVWVDTSMETYLHNQLKGEIGSGLKSFTKSNGSGTFFLDRMMLTNVQAGISTEPDGMFVLYETLRSGRAELRRQEASRELVGTPDMVLEIVSTTSRQKDHVVLRESYHRARVREYWLVDGLAGPVTFELLVWEPAGYVAAESRDGWTKSPVFGKSFRIAVSQNPAGLTDYTLEIRDELPGEEVP